MSGIQTYRNSDFSVNESKITLNFKNISLKYPLDFSYVAKMLSSVILVL